MSGSNSGLEVKPDDYMALYMQRRHDDLADQFLGILDGVAELRLSTVDEPQLLLFADAFVKNFLYFFSQPDFSPNATFWRHC